MSLKGILDRQLPKGRGEVSLSAFAFLFSEIIQYCQSTVSNVGELERRCVPMIQYDRILWKSRKDR